MRYAVLDRATNHLHERTRLVGTLMTPPRAAGSRRQAFLSTLPVGMTELVLLFSSGGSGYSAELIRSEQG